MRLVWTFALAALALGLLAPAAAAAEQIGPHYENPRWGYKVRAPKDWDRRAVSLEEKWIADKFFPAYVLRTRGTLADQVGHRPDLWVIGFPHAATQAPRVKREKIGEHGWRIEIRNPYKDYRDFVKREEWAAAGAGGWFIARDEKIEHAGFDVEVVEIKVEKLVEAPLRVIAWIYHTEDVDFAVQIRIFEEHYERNREVIQACLKSFRTIARTEPFPGALVEDEAKPGTGETPTLADVRSRIRAKVEHRIEREIDALPKGWIAKRSKHYVVLSQQDKQHTQYVVNFAESIRKYLDDHLGGVGDGDVPPGVIRVFANPLEENAYRQGTRGWWTSEVDEIVMTFSRGTDILGEFSGLGRRLTDQWLHAKNERLRDGLPSWLRQGLYSHMGWARPSKRKKMVLQPTPSAIRDLAVLLRTDTALPLKTLLQGEDVESFEHRTQAASVVHYLLTRGNRGKTKGALVNTMNALVEIIEEEDVKFEAEEAQRRLEARRVAEQEAQADAGKTDEELEREEDEAFRQRRERRSAFAGHFDAKARAIRLRAFEAGFGHLEEKDWKRLDKSWRSFAGRR